MRAWWTPPPGCDEDPIAIPHDGDMSAVLTCEHGEWGFFADGGEITLADVRRADA